MWPFGRSAGITPVVPIVEEPHRRRSRLPRLGGSLLHRRRHRAVPTPEVAVHPPAIAHAIPVLGMEGDHHEVDDLFLPDRVEDWPNFLVDMAFRPYPLPGHLEDSDRNHIMNISKGVLRSVLPDDQPVQPQDAAAVGDAADEDLDNRGAAVRRSASARMPTANENRLQLVRRGDATTLARRRPKRAARRSATQ